MPKHLLVAVAIDAAKGAVDVDDSAVVRGRDHDRVVTAVEDAVKSPLAIAQLIQHPLARGNVAPIRYQAGCSFDVQRGAAAPLHHPPRPVLVTESGAQHPLLRALLGDAPQILGNRFALFRMAEIESAPADQLFDPVAENPFR